MFKRMVCVCVSSLMASMAAPGADVGSMGVEAPSGYSVVVATEAGKRFVAHKAAAKSLSAALSAGLQDLSRWFDGKPIAKGAFADSKGQQRGGALFTATLKGQPVRGLIYCVNSEQGADVTVTYCRANAPATEWSKLTSGTNAPSGAAIASMPMHEYVFPDGTGSMQLPQGWKTDAQTSIHGVRIQGPAGQTVSLGINFTVNTPDSFIVKNQMQMAANARQMGLPPPKPIEMLVAAYTEPVTALKNLFPQLSQWSLRRGGPGITLDKILETPKPAQAGFSNGRAATIYYAFTKTTGGNPAPYRARGQYESWTLGPGAWYLHVSEASAPDATFDQDWPVMLAIATSLKTDPQAVQRATSRAIDAQNQNFQAMQRAHATQQAAFDDYLKSVQRNSIIRERSATDFDEVIRGVRTVEDTQTGYRTSVDLGNVDQIVDRLNEHDPGRYIQIPLRDEVAPLPPSSRH